jgi:hypothetical protein
MWGGEDKSTYYPPELSEMRRWGVCNPYERGAASTERMQHVGFSPVQIVANLAIRDALAYLITLNLRDVAKIEKDRQRTADGFNSLLKASAG